MINNSRPLFDLFIKETCISAINLKSPFFFSHLLSVQTLNLLSFFSKKLRKKPPKLLKNKIPPIASLSLFPHFSPLK